MVLTVGSLLSTATTKGLQTPFVHNYEEQIFGKCFFNYLKSWDYWFFIFCILYITNYF